MITRKLVGVSRSDASIAPTGVGGSLKAWITCGKKTGVNMRTEVYMGRIPSEDNYTCGEILKMK